MARYRKISVAMWGDEKFCRLSKPQPNAQTLWLFLLTGPYSTIIPGCVRAKPGVLAAELEWSTEAFDKAFGEVCEEGLVRVDRRVGLLWLPNGLKHNPPANPNVVRAWREAFNELPDCELKQEIEKNIMVFLESLSSSFAEAFAKAFPQTSRKQDQDQDQEQDQYFSPSADAEESDPETEPKTIPPPRKKRAAKAEKPREPLPFTVAETLDAIEQGSGGRFAKAPFDKRLAPAITAVIRQLAEQAVTLDDVRLAGEFIAAKWTAGFEIGPAWVAKTGNLTETIARARKWQERSRASPGANRRSPDCLSVDQWREYDAQRREETNAEAC